MHFRNFEPHHNSTNNLHHNTSNKRHHDSTNMQTSFLSIQFHEHQFIITVRFCYQYYAARSSDVHYTVYYAIVTAHLAALAMVIVLCTMLQLLYVFMQ